MCARISGFPHTWPRGKYFACGSLAGVYRPLCRSSLRRTLFSKTRRVGMAYRRRTAGSIQMSAPMRISVGQAGVIVPL